MVAPTCASHCLRFPHWGVNMPKMCLDNEPIFSSLYSLYFYQFLRQTAHKTYSLLNAQKSSLLMAFYRVGYSTTRQIHRPFGAQQHRLLKSKQCLIGMCYAFPQCTHCAGGTGICDSQKPRYGNTSTAFLCCCGIIIGKK